MKAIMLIPELLFSSGYFENLSIELKKKRETKTNKSHKTNKQKSSECKGNTVKCEENVHLAGNGKRLSELMNI